MDVDQKMEDKFYSQICCCCNRILPIDNFCKDLKSPKKVARRCRSCNRLRHQKSEKILEYKKINEEASKFKICSSCHFVKISSDFAGKNNICLTCGANHDREKRVALRDVEIRRNDYCEICLTYEEVLCRDHCHKTHKFRGYICKFCNKSLGHFKDSMADISSAIRYLVNAPEPTCKYIPNGAKHQAYRERKMMIKKAPTLKPSDTCAIEGCLEEELSADHQHGYTDFRGWLCNNHNLGIGNAKDSPMILALMYEYLK